MKNLIIVLTVLFFFLLIACNGNLSKSSYNSKAIELNKSAGGFIQHAQYDSALVLLNKSIETDKTYYTAYINKIAVYWHLSDFSSALSVSEKLTTLFPGNIEGWQISGFLSDIICDTAKARQYYTRTLDLLNAQIALQKNDDSMKAIRFNRALTLLLLGNENEAKNEFQLIKELYPKWQLPSDDIIDHYFAMAKADYIKSIKGISNQ